MFWLLVLVVAASVQLLTSAPYLVKRSGDPMLEMCFPLCENETIMEMECAQKYECFQVSMPDDFTDCLTPCWSLASSCFTLCSQSFNIFIITCTDNCSNSEEETCVSNCFNTAFSQLRNDVVNHTQNDTIDFRTNSEPTSTGNALVGLTEQEASTLSPDVEFYAASSPFLRLVQNKTLRSDKSNSIKVVHEDADAGYDTPTAPGNLETLYDKNGDTLANYSADFDQAENNFSKISSQSSWKPSKQMLHSFLLNYRELLEDYFKVSFSLDSNASERISNIPIGNAEIYIERSHPERNGKPLKEVSDEIAAPLNKAQNYENESKIDRLLQANREFLQRDGVDMDNADKALNKLLEFLQGSPETGSELIG